MSARARVYLGIGSNIERERYITAGLDALRENFGELQVSPVYESAAVGFDGEPFLNLVAAIDTDLAIAELARCLKAIEAANGRRRGEPRYSPRTLDLDILTYDDVVGSISGVELPRAEILTNAFVLRPLADLAPEERHPVEAITYLELWRQYRRDQKLWPVAFSWRGQPL